jgi:hypothetical protein
MTAHDTLEQLAQARGISLRTAMRYHAAGVNLADAQAVEEHKYKLRTRRGVSKLNRRTLAEPAAVAAIDYEDVISAVHFALVVLKLKYPDLAADIQAITQITGPVIDRITEEL